MTAALLPNGKQQYFTTAGLPAVGYKIATFDAGTNNPRITWQDALKVAQNTNPVILDGRGEASIFWEGVYKVQLQDSTGAVIWTQDNLQSQPNGFAISLVPSTNNAIDLGSITLAWRNIYIGASNAPILDTVTGNIGYYARTAAEIAAAVTPANFSYPSGYVDRYGINTTQGTTDMTQAIKNAVLVNAAGGSPVQFLDALYLVSDTAIAIGNVQPRVTIQGVPLGTRILNKASANKPTIKMSGAQYFDISGLVLIGATGFTNDGVQMVKDGSSNRCAFGTLRKIVCQTNGYGIEIQDTNTVVIEDYSYWPSGGGAFGGTIDVNGQPGGIFMSGTGAVNGITLRNINIGGLNSIATGGCGILIDGHSSGAAFQAIELDELECETVGTRALWGRNVNIGSFKNLFTENADVRFDWNCVGVSISEMEGGGTGTLVLDGTTGGGANLRTLITNCQGKSFTADAANSETVQINNIWSVAPGNSDASINRVQINVRTTGSALQADTYQPIWVTPAFAAGVYTASAGNWTVSSGNELTHEYLVQGKRATVNFHVTGTSVSATPGLLFAALPNAMQSAKDVWVPFIYSEDGGATTKIGIAHLQAASNQLVIAKDFASTAWATTAGLTRVSFSATFEIV